MRTGFGFGRIRTCCFPVQAGRSTG